MAAPVAIAGVRSAGCGVALAEYQAQVVRRHGERVGEGEAVLIGERGERFHVAQPPLGIVRAKFGIELRIARSRVAAALAIGAVQIQKILLREYLACALE